MRKIVFASFEKYPDISAGATYHLNIGKSFNKMGWEVVFIGDCNYNKETNKFTYVNIRPKLNNFFTKIFWHIAKNTIIYRTLIKKYTDIDILFVSSNINFKTVKRISKYFKRKSLNTKILISLVEKYTHDEFENTGFLTKKMINNNSKFIEKYNDDNVRFLCISRYLQFLLRQRDIDSFYLPFCFEPIKTKGINLKSKLKNLTLFYAGFPSKKDDIIFIMRVLVDAKEMLIQNGIKIFFAGLTKEYFRDKVSEFEYREIDNIAVFLGRLSRKKVCEYFNLVHFTILARDPNKEFAKAGFPTKIAESLTYGVPVISNISSDLSSILEDNKNSYLFTYGNADSLINAIKKALFSFEGESYSKLCNNCCNTINDRLNSDFFVAKLLTFLGEEK